MDNHLLCSTAIKLVQSIFAPNEVVFAFITGSRAKENYRVNSDVDLFVVIDEPNYEKEKKLAEALKSFHVKYNLNFDHCGEIFSKRTFESLLSKIDKVGNLINNGFCKMACFQSECILSVARKALVILTMLSQKKTYIIGNKTLLGEYEKIANNFFVINSHISLSTNNEKIIWSDKHELINKIREKHQFFTQKLAMNDLLDTPIGISLERFFLNDISFTENEEILSSNSFHLSENLCPIGNLGLSSIKNIVYSQCLGFQ